MTRDPTDMSTMEPSSTRMPDPTCGSDSWQPGWGKTSEESCTEWWNNFEWGAKQDCRNCPWTECAGTCCAHCGHIGTRDPTDMSTMRPTDPTSGRCIGEIDSMNERCGA